MLQYLPNWEIWIVLKFKHSLRGKTKTIQNERERERGGGVGGREREREGRKEGRRVNYV